MNIHPQFDQLKHEALRGKQIAYFTGQPFLCRDKLSILRQTEAHLKVAGIGMRKAKRIFRIALELMENIRVHAAYGQSMTIAIYQNSDAYYIFTKNSFVPVFGKDDKERILNYTRQLSNMDSVEKKQLSRTLFTTLWPTGHSFVIISRYASSEITYHIVSSHNDCDEISLLVKV